jgi:hypothetical protein
MTLDKAMDKAALYFDVIGKEVKHLKKGKTKRVSRITAYKKKDDKWDVAVFFVRKQKNDTVKPDTFLDQFLEKYEVISIEK